MGQEDPEHTWFQLELLAAETSCRRQTKHMGGPAHRRREAVPTGAARSPVRKDHGVGSWDVEAKLESNADYSWALALVPLEWGLYPLALLCRSRSPQRSPWQGPCDGKSLLGPQPCQCGWGVVPGPFRFSLVDFAPFLLGADGVAGGGQADSSALQRPCPLLLTSQNQARWQERIQKEAAARVAWKIKYGHEYRKEGTVPRRQLQQAPFRSALVAGPAPATGHFDYKEVQVGRPETKGVRNQLSGAVGVQGAPSEGDRGTTQGPAGQTRPEGLEMRQAPPSTLQLLFQGISHDGQGRALYLRERHRQKPEEKFRYPIVSSWEYGWHVGISWLKCRTDPVWGGKCHAPSGPQMVLLLPPVGHTLSSRGRHEAHQGFSVRQGPAHHKGVLHQK
ncbi:uncharacterized protein LOC123623387 [Lemur catta]|uniref:uncharacterized protein LOC123623387 n=1 Tax=Lemur catta TaxID=9447 RepID=UPI001E26DD4F|nr:uncharacterized protein LOC123623387 [Lemur catta]